MQHKWIEFDGEIDIFRLDHGYHNGPECEVCGLSFCHHCTPKLYETECKGEGNYDEDDYL